jgi:transposase InsO family protein
MKPSPHAEQTALSALKPTLQNHSSHLHQADDIEEDISSTQQSPASTLTQAEKNSSPSHQDFSGSQNLLTNPNLQQSTLEPSLHVTPSDILRSYPRLPQDTQQQLTAILNAVEALFPSSHSGQHNSEAQCEDSSSHSDHEHIEMQHDEVPTHSDPLGSEAQFDTDLTSSSPSSTISPSPGGEEDETSLHEDFNMEDEPEITISTATTSGLHVVPSNPYLPGKICGKTLHLLLDTGCTNSILSKSMFDRLPAPTRSQLRPSESGATMADGSRTKIYGQISLLTKLRCVKKTIHYHVARTHHDAILGMDFFNQGCKLDLGKAIFEIDGKQLACTDKFGNPLSSKVQVLKSTEIPPGAESSVTCRLVHFVSGQQGLVEGGLHSQVAVAACLVTPAADTYKLPVRCYNPASHPITLSAGSVIGSYVAINEDQISSTSTCNSNTPEVNQLTTSKDTVEVHILPEDNTHATGFNTDLCSIPEHVRTLYIDAIKNCNSQEECHEVAKLLNAYSDVFSSGPDDVGLTDLVTHSIPVIPGTKPIKQPPRRLGPHRDEEVERQVQELLKQGRIEPHNGAWSSPVVLVSKKDGSWRMCIDYRRLNSVTQQDAYPLPRIDDSLDSLAGSKYFSTLDLLSGYWQVPLDSDAQDKSAFVTRGGLWRWKVLPFGLTSAPACFERLMERVLSGLQWKTLLLYLDDVIVFGSTFSQHQQRLEEVLRRFRAAKLKLKPSKCELLRPQVAYLGHVVSSESISTDPKKIEAVKKWTTPQCQTEVRTFLGFVGYYRRFVNSFASIAKPLSILTGQHVPFQWNSEHQHAFETLRDAMLTAPILAYPNPADEYTLDTDASNDGLGAVLSQHQNGEEKVIAYWSKTLSPAERNYCVTRRELLAVIEACKHFRPYLYGRKFKLRTDHASLIWLRQRKEPHDQVARWLEILAEFQYQIEHRPGSKHGNADGLSRQTCSDCKKCKSIEQRDGGPTRQEVEAALHNPENNLLCHLHLEDLTHESPDTCTINPPCNSQEIAHVHVHADAQLPNTHITCIESDYSTDSDSGLNDSDLESTSSTDQEDFILEANAFHTAVSGTKEIQELAEAQQCAPSDLASIYMHIKDNTEITRGDVDTHGSEFKHLASLKDHLIITKEGVLKANILVGKKRRQVSLCPPHWRRDVIWNTHKLMHQGINRTLWRIQLDWYWPGMAADIRRQIQSCGTCQAAKHGRKTKPSARQRLYAGRPWQLVSVDLVGPFTKTARGNTMILVIVDHFTRWRDALPLPDGTAISVARMLDDQVFSYFGVPERIHSDQGAQFESNLMQELCALWGTDKSHTTPYHPEGNGVVERGNRDLGDSLRSLLLEADEQEWDLLLPQIMRSIRASPHHTTGETANYMMFGRELRLPDQLIYGKSVERPTTREAYAVQLQERLTKVHDTLRQQQINIRSQDINQEPAFKEGEYVMMANRKLKKGQTAKLAEKYVGPYKVIQVFPNRTYHIARDGQASIENETRLKKYYGPLDPRAEAPVKLEPTRRKAMMGRPAVPRKPIHPAVLNKLQELDDKTQELEKNQQNPLTDKSRDLVSDTMVDNLIDYFPSAGPVPAASSYTNLTTEPSNSFKDYLLQDHNYAINSKKKSFLPPPDGSSYVIVTPKVGNQPAGPLVNPPPLAPANNQQREPAVLEPLPQADILQPIPRALDPIPEVDEPVVFPEPPERDNIQAGGEHLQQLTAPTLADTHAAPHQPNLTLVNNNNQAVKFTAPGSHSTTSEQPDINRDTHHENRTTNKSGKTTPLSQPPISSITKTIITPSSNSNNKNVVGIDSAKNPIKDSSVASNSKLSSKRASSPKPYKPAPPGSYTWKTADQLQKRAKNQLKQFELPSDETVKTTSQSTRSKAATTSYVAVKHKDSKWKKGKITSTKPAIQLKSQSPSSSNMSNIPKTYQGNTSGISTEQGISADEISSLSEKKKIQVSPKPLTVTVIPPKPLPSATNLFESAKEKSTALKYSQKCEKSTGTISEGQHCLGTPSVTTGKQKDSNFEQNVSTNYAQTTSRLEIIPNLPVYTAIHQSNTSSPAVHSSTSKNDAISTTEKTSNSEQTSQTTNKITDSRVVSNTDAGQPSNVKKTRYGREVRKPNFYSKDYVLSLILDACRAAYQ